MQSDEKLPLLRMVAVADQRFERACGLETHEEFDKKGPVGELLKENHQEALTQCIAIWSAVTELLPASPLDQPRQKALRIDAAKVSSRCAQKLGDLDGARGYIAKAIDIGYQEGFISLGAICLKLGDHEAAEAAFLSAIAKEVQKTRAYAGLGELYFAMGTEQLKKDPTHTAYFRKSEEAFIEAGKSKFTDSFDRAIELFGKVGLKDRALAVADTAAGFYGEHRGTYGEKLRALDATVRRLAGDKRRDKLVTEIGSKISKILANKYE